MTAEIHEVPYSQPNEEVISLLEELLEDARSGELRCVMAIGLLRGGYSRTAWGGEPDYYLLSGMVARLQHRIQMIQDDLCIPVEVGGESS